jgi:hypothetical protein
MSLYQVCKALHQIYINKEATMAARVGDFSMLDPYDLTSEERAAIEQKDFVTLYRLGAHPILLFHFSAVLNPRETYIREIVPKIQDVPNPFYDYYKNPKNYGK